MTPATGALRTAAEDLEAYLGDPRDPARTFSYARCAELDRAEALPVEICRLLDAWGLHHHYVPAALGGRLRSYPDALALVRLVARRDLTVAIAHAKTFLGSACAWVLPPDDATRRLAAHVLAGRVVSLGLTEPDHGSDLLAGEVTATATPDGGHLLNGTKWLVNNATAGDLLTVLARTRPEGGPRGFDVFVVEKDALPPGSWTPLPKVRTVGIRGADISGISLRDAPVPASARLGAPGGGLEIVLKALRLTRTLCATLSLGAADHALSLAVPFAAGRNLYGRRLVDLPAAAATLVDALADQLLAEAVTLVATRSIHVLPGDLAVSSAVVKYLVPQRTDRLIETLGGLLGARSLLTEHHEDGRFEKLARDHRIVGIFDGNAVVTLAGLVTEFPAVARAAGRPVPWPAVQAALAAGDPVDDVDPLAFRLVSRPGGALVHALPELVARAGTVAADRPGAAPVVEAARRLLDHWSAVLADVAAYRPVPRAVPASAFRTAERLALCYAGAAVLGLWVGARERAPEGSDGADPLRGDDHRTAAALVRVLAGLGTRLPRCPARDAALLAEALERYGEEGRRW